MTVWHCLVPAEIDDPARPSGGNHYDRRLIDGLRALGWTVREHRIGGLWPGTGTQAGEALAEVLGGLPAGAIVLFDGLALDAAADALAAHCVRLRLVALLHAPVASCAMPVGMNAQALLQPMHTLLQHMRAIIVTSAWSQRCLCRHYGLATAQVAVALPGVDPAALAPVHPGGERLLCVARVSPLKGHDTLLRALGTLHGLTWHLSCIGPVDDTRFLDDLHGIARAAEVDDRVRFLGPSSGPQLALAYQNADVLLLASRQESYGMVVSEALARGLPVIATAVGGIPEALGAAAAGPMPGLLVAPASPAALASAVRRWLTDAHLRGQLRLAARHRRSALRPWSDTAQRVAAVLARV